jgi:hypothetical protein
MPKRVAKYTVEHWREGELFAKVTLTKDNFHRQEDGTGFIIFPPGYIELVTGDELHFDCDGLVELLNVNA